MRTFYCQPCDHRWWQHRHPDRRMRLLGKVMIAVGAFQTGVGLILLLRGGA